MLRWCCDGGTRSVSPPPPSGLRRVGLCTALDNSKEPSLVLSDASSKVMPAPSSRTPPIPAAIAWLAGNNFRSLMLPWPSLVTLLLLNGAQWYFKDGDTDDFQRKGKIKSVQKGSCPHRKDRVHTERIVSTCHCTLCLSLLPDMPFFWGAFFTIRNTAPIHTTTVPVKPQKLLYCSVWLNFMNVKKAISHTIYSNSLTSIK